jgi:hypothetical protein
MNERHDGELPHRPDGPKESGKPTEARAFSAPEQRLAENRRDAFRALGAIKEGLQQDDETSNLWSMKVQEWGPEVAKALQEPKGSVPEEREEMVEPLAALVAQVFYRTPPDVAVLQERSDDPEDKRIEAEGKAAQEAAQRTLRMLLDRYPNKLSARDVAQGNDGALMRKIGEEMAESGLYGDIGEGLKMSSRTVDLEPINRLGEIDRLLEGLSERMMTVAIDDAQAVYEGKIRTAGETQESHYRQAVDILPHLKAMVDLREAVSRRIFGHIKSPNDVLTVLSARDGVGKAYGTEPQPSSAAEREAGAEREMTEEEEKISGVMKSVAEEERKMPSRFRTIGTFGDAVSRLAPPGENLEKWRAGLMVALLDDVDKLSDEIVGGRVELTEREKQSISDSREEMFRQVLIKELAAERIFARLKQRLPGLEDEWAKTIAEERNRLLARGATITPVQPFAFRTMILSIQKRLENGR